MAGTARDSGINLLVLPGDGIGPEIVAATIDVLRETDRCFGLNLRLEQAPIGFEALKSAATTFPDAVLEKAKAADGVILGPVSHNEYPPSDRGDSILRANYANASISTPISGPPARAPACRPAARANSILSSFAKIPRAFMPIARCMLGPVSSCLLPISRWRSAR